MDEQEYNEWVEAEKWLRERPEFIQFLPPSIRAKAQQLQEEGVKPNYYYENIEKENARIDYYNQQISKPAVVRTIETPSTNQGTSTEQVQRDYLKEVSYKILPPYVREAPLFVRDTFVSLGKGTVKAGLYAIDEIAIIQNPVSSNARVSDKIPYLKDWSGYEFSRNPIYDTDYQNVALTTALVGAGGLTVKAGSRLTQAGYTKIGTTVKETVPISLGTFGSYQAYKNPSEYNIAAAGVMWTPVVSKSVKNQYVKTGAKEVSYNEVFGSPFSENKADIINKFEATRTQEGYMGVHTTASKFSKFEYNPQRIEDKGIFVANYGGGNVNWLKVGNEERLSYTLNPFKTSSKPNVIKIQFKTLSELPSEVVTKGNIIYSNEGRAASYKYVNKWYDTNAKPNTAYIPFRTERWETKETQAIIPYKYETQLSREGNIIQRFKGYKEYVNVNGVNVPIKEFKTAEGKGMTIERLDKKYENIASENYYPTKYQSYYKINNQGTRLSSYSKSNNYESSSVKISSNIKSSSLSSKTSTTKYYSSYKPTSYKPQASPKTTNANITFTPTPKTSYSKKVPYLNIVSFKPKVYYEKNTQLQAKKKTGYMPSYSAIIFNLKGKPNKTKVETGINYRPIPKGFTYIKRVKP